MAERIQNLMVQIVCESAMWDSESAIMALFCDNPIRRTHHQPCHIYEFTVYNLYKLNFPGPFTFKFETPLGVQPKHFFFNY